MLRLLICLCVIPLAALARTPVAPQVAVIEDAPWSPGDTQREGAAELEIMLRVAQLQQEHDVVGLVGVGDRRGLFQDGTRRGLEFAVQQGVPVVRLARGMQNCLKGTDDLFINGGMLSPEDASALLSKCLARHGALPVVKATQKLDESALRALRKKLKLYQAEFTARQVTLVASR